MTSEFPSAVLNRGPSWPGFDALKFLVVFGASYCDVGYEYAVCEAPSAAQPLGVPFPGTTYAEPDQPNWVGHLVTNYFTGKGKGGPLLVYDYAKGGARVHNVRNQVQMMFCRHAGAHPRPWKAGDTLFVTWVGINDSAVGSDHADNMATLLEAQEALFVTGARNFLFVNVPPIDRSPTRGTKRRNYVGWNTALQTAAASFAAAHPDATVLIYSAWDTFNALLDDPEAHGFPVGDVRKAGGAIWYDNLHPTSRVHDFVARDMSAFLGGVPTFGEESGF
ncbi:hypothetical protein FB451DRAFT_754571 [Mycena latifolia]|nr:hypothetical protein FB451DRAFT_754571 [Mycena latifolia]